MGGFLVGWVFERRSKKVLDRLQNIISTDFHNTISKEISNLSERISEKVSDFSNSSRTQLEPITKSVERIANGIDNLVKHFRRE
jgi:gas vesicle protein